MNCKNLLRVASTALCLLSSGVFAQQLTIGKILVEGTVTPYTPAAIQAVSLLYDGEETTPAGIQLATDRLLQTGAFTSVKSAISGSSNNTTVAFTVKTVAASQLLTVGFENFVWLTTDQLEDELTKLVPLYNGTIPNSASQLNAVALALQQILETKGITANVTRVPVQSTIGIATWVAEYHADVPNIRVNNIYLAGVPIPLQPAAEATIKSLVGAAYNEGRSPLSLKYTLLTPFQNAGYQASSVNLVSRSIASSNSSGVEVNVNAILTLGPLYHFSSINWTVSPQLNENQFLAICPIRAGSLASVANINQTVQNVTSAYHNEGFLEVSVRSSQTLNTTTHESAMYLNAVAGPQYIVGTVTPVNLTAAQKTEFEDSWQLYPGAIYSQSYVTNYIKAHTGVQGYETSLNTVAGSGRHEVDLTLTFTKGAAFTP